jgi:hypothetical protein
VGELIDDADVEEPEPRRLDDAALGPLRPRRHPGGDERVDEDLEVAPDGVGGDTDLPSDRGGVDDLSVGECRRFEESLEGGEVARQGFGEDLLAQIVADIGLELGGGFWGKVVRGDEAATESLLEGEIRNLGGAQREKLVAHRAATEEVAAVAEKLPRARSGEDELQPVSADEGVNLVEERGELLDLVDDDRLPGARQGGALLRKHPRIGREATKLAGREEIVGRSVGEERPQERALPRLPRAPQEAGFFHETSGIDDAFYHDKTHFYCRWSSRKSGKLGHRSPEGGSAVEVGENLPGFVGLVGDDRPLGG